MVSGYSCTNEVAQIGQATSECYAFHETSECVGFPGTSESKFWEQLCQLTTDYFLCTYAVFNCTPVSLPRLYDRAGNCGSFACIAGYNLDATGSACVIIPTSSASTSWFPVELMGFWLLGFLLY